jgi:hypothetical protein
MFKSAVSPCKEWRAFRVCTCIKASSIRPSGLSTQAALFYQTVVHPFLEYLQTSSSLSFLPTVPPAPLLLRALIPPYFLPEMISKSFPIQPFVALLIIASSSTSPVNAAAIAPGSSVPLSRYH